MHTTHPSPALDKLSRQLADRLVPYLAWQDRVTYSTLLTGLAWSACTWLHLPRASLAALIAADVIMAAQLAIGARIARETKILADSYLQGAWQAFKDKWHLVAAMGSITMAELGFGWARWILYATIVAVIAKHLRTRKKAP